MDLKQLFTRLNTRSFDRVFFRLKTIVERYGLTPGRYEKNLLEMMSCCSDYNIKPTFPVTASVVARHGELFRNAQQLGAEFAVHGLRHIDYTQVDAQEAGEDLLKALEIFKLNAIETSGFRYPYLRWNDETVQVVRRGGLFWDSSQAVAWDKLDRSLFSKLVWSNYQCILGTYQARPFSSFEALPVAEGDFIHIPVAVPDDDILLERLELRCHNRLSQILLDMLEDFRANETLLVLQLHPERYEGFRDGLRAVLSEARRHQNIWMASLNEIAEWWLRRVKYEYEFFNTNDGWQWQHPAVNEFSFVRVSKEGVRPMNTGQIISSKKIPAFYVHTESRESWLPMLRNLGYAVVTDGPEEACAVVVKCGLSPDWTTAEKMAAESEYDVFRLQRWPAGYTSALAVSGDIDGVDLIDFWERFRGN